MANSEWNAGVLLLRRLNHTEVLVQLLLICILKCATIHNSVEISESCLYLVLIHRLSLASSLLCFFQCINI